MAKLTPKQAAERAGVSRGLIYAWCDQQALPHYRFGGKGKRGKILIDEAELDSFIESRKVDQASVPPACAPASSGSPATPFSELDSRRLAKAWQERR
jgi:excisionase family DNA binding protein